MDKNLNELGKKLENSFPNVTIALPIKELGEGYASEVVETNDGIVFKIAKNHIVQETYKKEHKLLIFLTSVIKGFIIPYPEHYIESSNEFPFGLIGYKKVPGDIFKSENINNSQLKDIASRIADFLYQLHSIDISLPEIGSLDLEPIPPALDEVKQTWINVSDWLKDNLNEEEYIKVRDFWREAEDFWETDTQSPVLAHGDIWFENIILDKDNNVVGIINFGSVKIGDKAIDFAVQNHVSDEFRDEVIRQYKLLGGGVGNNIEKRMDYLLAVREIYGLEYGMMTNKIDPNILKKIKRTMLK